MKIKKGFRNKNFMVVIAIIIIVIFGAIIGNELKNDDEEENERIQQKENYQYNDTNSLGIVPLTTKDYDFPVEESAKRAKITLSWISDFVDYNLYIYDSEGNEVGSSAHYLNPYEYEEVVIEGFDVYGTYKAEVEYITGDGEYNIKISVFY